jgi:mRNA interferase HigB
MDQSARIRPGRRTGRRNVAKGNQFGYFCFYSYLYGKCGAKMNIYNRSSLIAFYRKHSDCKGTLEKWYHDVASKTWRRPGDVTRDFNTARTIKNSRVIFNINENDYRLIAEVNYQKAWVFIKFIGTHSEYDKINPVIVNQSKAQK